MPGSRPPADPGPLSLRERLAALRDAFLALAARVREHIAALVGTAVADAVRQAVRAWLDGAAPAARPPGPRPPRPLSETLDDDLDEPGAAWRPDEFEDDPPPPAEPRPAPAALPGRLAAAALAGWRAARWWLARRGSRPAWAAWAAGAAAGLAALALLPWAAPAAGPALAAVLLAEAGVALAALLAP